MRDELLTKNELDRLAREEQAARRDFHTLRDAAQEAGQMLQRAEKLHLRAKLWAQADRLRRELAEVENQAGKITL